MNLATQLHGSQAQWDPRSMDTTWQRWRGNKRLENTQVRSKRIEKVGCKKIIDCQTEVNYEDNDKDDDRAQGRDDDGDDNNDDDDNDV